MAKGKNRTGGDRSKLSKALSSKGQSARLYDRERNMRPPGGRGEEHSRMGKKKR